MMVLMGMTGLTVLTVPGMNSFEYIEVSVRLDPFSQEMAEILTAELSTELPYDMFLVEEPFLKCYIETEKYRASDLKVILSGYPAAVSFDAVPVQGRNWNRAWEESFQPLVVEGTVTGRNRSTRTSRVRVTIYG